MIYHDITLPIPVSVNKAYVHGGGYRCQKTGKWRGVVARSSEYNSWVQIANAEWFLQYPRRVREIFKGRIRVDYVFHWHSDDPAAYSSDIGNREKALSDFMQKKFIENDNQIDMQIQHRKISTLLKTCAVVRIIQIPDQRFDPFIGNPAYPQPHRSWIKSP